MERRGLGATGLEVSALGFGCGNVGGLMVRGEPADRTRAVALAMDAGITYFDTAPQYGNGQSEENLGQALRELNAWSRVVVGTKVRLTLEDLARPSAAVRRSVEESLRRLGHDSVDLLQLHNHVAPTSSEAGGVTLERSSVLGGVVAALREIQRDGLAGHVGFTGLGDTATLHEVIRSGSFETVQAYYNVVNPSAGYPGVASSEQDFAGLIDSAAAGGLGVIAIRVLAAGALVGHSERHPLAGSPGAVLAHRADYATDVSRAQALAPLVTELGLESPLELALRFALAKTGISTVLFGLSELSHLENAIRWAERGPLPIDAVDRALALMR